MDRATFLGSLASQCGTCAIRALVVTALLVGPAVLPAGAQERVDPALEIMPASRVPVSPMLAARSSGSPELIREASASPFVERFLSFAAPPRRAYGLGAAGHRSFLAGVEKQRTPFQSQVRLPIREFFGGRLELACMHSRARHVGVHSAVPRSGLGYRLHSPYSASLAPRTRASLSLGFWFRFSGS